MRFRRFRSLRPRPRFRRTCGLLAALMVALVGAGCSEEGDTRRITVEFATGTSLFDSAPVRLRGVDIGRVADVRPVGDGVEAVLELDQDIYPSKDSGAAVLPRTVLGERYVQLIPGDGNEQLESGDRIPRSRTSTPAEIDDLLEGLDHLARSIDNDQFARTATNLADLLHGNGDDLGELLGETATVVELVASESDQLERLVADLAGFSTAVADRSETVLRFAEEYRGITDVLAQEQDLLSRAIISTDAGVTELGDLIFDHREALAEQLEIVTTTGRTLERNRSLLGDVVEETARLFAGAGRMYDAERNLMRVNPHFTELNITRDVLSQRLADRVRGICRRLEAAGGTAPEISACAGGRDFTRDGLPDDLIDVLRELEIGGTS